MNAPSSEDRIRELVRDLRPVRPIPPLRVGLALVAGAGLAAVLLGWRFELFLPRAWADSAWSDPRFLLILAGLALVAFGATHAALASAVPGRDRAVRIGIRIGGLGILLALACGLLGVARTNVDLGPSAMTACAGCLISALVLGLASCVVACFWIARAAMRHLQASAALSLAGGVAIGAVAIHAHCPAGDAFHQLVAHAGAPLIATAVLTPLVALALRYATRRNRFEATRPNA